MTDQLPVVGYGSKDQLHVKEIMEWNTKVNSCDSIPSGASRSENTNGVFGFVGDLMLSPSMMGLYSIAETNSQIKVLNQFKKDFGLENTVLMPCSFENHTVQPCYCACMKYRAQAHVLFHCDVCQRVPIGKMYACAECDALVYNLCQECYDKYDHQCGNMTCIKYPFSKKESDAQYWIWIAVQKVREPVNTLRGQCQTSWIDSLIGTQSVLDQTMQFLNMFYNI